MKLLSKGLKYTQRQKDSIIDGKGQVYNTTINACAESPTSLLCLFPYLMYKIDSSSVNLSLQNVYGPLQIVKLVIIMYI